MILQDRMTVISQKQIGHNIFEMKLAGNWSGKSLPRPVCPYPGVRLIRTITRRPISIASIDKEAGRNDHHLPCGRTGNNASFAKTGQMMRLMCSVH